MRSNRMEMNRRYSPQRAKFIFIFKMKNEKGEIIMKRREDIVLRIEHLKQKGIQNSKLIAKWERILRNFDSQNLD